MTQEFDAQQDKWIDIALGLDRHGVVLVRRGLDPAMLDRLLTVVRAEYLRRDGLAATGQLGAAWLDMHLKFRAIAVHEVAVEGVPAVQLLLTPMIQAIATLLLSKLPGITMSSFRCVQVGADNLALPYHQDSRIVEAIEPSRGPAPSLVNLWVPMHDCGLGRPGLEIVNQPVASLVPTVATAENFYSSIATEIAPDQITRLSDATQLWHPAFRAGDFMLFKGTMIHRTYVSSDMTDERISADIRLL